MSSFQKKTGMNLLYEGEIPSRELTVHIPPLEIVNNHRLKSTFREKGRIYLFPGGIFFSTCKFSGQFLGGPGSQRSIFLDGNQVTTELWFIIWKGSQKTQSWNFKPPFKEKCCRDFQLGKQKIRKKKTKGQNIMFHHLLNLLFDVSTSTKSSPPQKKTYLGTVFLTSRELKTSSPSAHTTVIWLGFQTLDAPSGDELQRRGAWIYKHGILKTIL